MYADSEYHGTYEPTEQDLQDWNEHCAMLAADVDEYVEDEYTEEEYYRSEGACTSPNGHSFKRTGTAYGGDDPRWGGEGRCLCIYCGADGDV